MNAKELIARRVALELHDGDIVNLGIGLPTQVVNYLPTDIHITLQSENGFLGLAPVTEAHPNLVNAGGLPCGILPGGAAFDSAFSFALIRGGHVDVSVLGGLQVDQNANLANWMVPGKMVPGMGGAMDLVTGARRVSMVVTELAVFSFEQGKLVLKEHAPGVSLETISAKTDAEFSVAPDFKVMPVAVEEGVV